MGEKQELCKQNGEHFLEEKNMMESMKGARKWGKNRNYANKTENIFFKVLKYSHRVNKLYNFNIW